MTSTATTTYVGRRRAATTTYVGTTTAQVAPAERILPGIGRQLVNTFDDKGNWLHQTSHRGTERQARAKGLLRITHDTDPAYASIVAAFLGTE